MKIKSAESGKDRRQKRIVSTVRRLKGAALSVFSEKSIDAVAVEEITGKADLGKGALCEHFEDKQEVDVTPAEEQVSICLSTRLAPLKAGRLACAVTGFVFGFFSSAMIGMSAEEIDTNVAPLRRVFVGSLVTFLGR